LVYAEINVGFGISSKNPILVMLHEPDYREGKERVKE
jgi:hypothetical protein